MLTELKRCNTVGNISGLLFLVSMLSGKTSISKSEIANRCSLERDISLNCGGAIAFFEYIGYADVSANMVTATERLNDISNNKPEVIISEMVKDCVSTLTDEGIFDADITEFNVEQGRLNIKKSAFPLAYAAIRNFLTMCGVLENEVSNEIGISDTYEADFSALLRKRKQKFSMKQLIQNQADQAKRGLEAEEFVLRLEQKRLPERLNKIKRISDFDVSAGYDIVSFTSPESVLYDRFIEVKCFLGSPHFYWSENEVDVASIRCDKYYLCLVDYSKINQPGYVPEFIQNPYKVIFNDNKWMVNTASYRVEKV